MDGGGITTIASEASRCTDALRRRVSPLQRTEVYFATLFDKNGIGCNRARRVNEPVTVLSTPASMATVKATVGVVGVGLVTAAEAYLQLVHYQGWSYREDNGYLFSPPA